MTGKKFNTTGPCLQERHYMLPPEQRLAQVRDLIDDHAFFVIHAPRQTGKTTLLRNLSRQLTEGGRYAIPGRTRAGGDGIPRRR